MANDKRRKSKKETPPAPAASDNPLVIKSVRIGTQEYRPLVCKIVERHPITHEPWKLQVISYQETVSLANGDEFAVLYADSQQFHLSTLSANKE